MRLPEPAFSDIQKMIRHLETQIINDAVTPNLLFAMQGRLDLVDKKFRDDPAETSHYHQLYELQGLIYGQQNKDAQAQEFIDEAVKAAGGITKLSSPLLRSYLTDKKLEPAPADSAAVSKDIVFFAKRPIVLVLLSVFSFRLYDVYWFAKNWAAVRAATEQKLLPFWRGLFGIFYAGPLFSIVLKSARRHGSVRRLSGRWLAAFYIVLWFVGTVLSVIPLLIVQKEIRFNNAHVSKKPKAGMYQKLKFVDVMIILVGFVAWAGIGVAVAAHEHVFNPANLTQIGAKRDDVARLSNQYKQCSDSLNQQRKTIDTNDDAAVASYNASYTSCEKVLKQQNKAVDVYNSLLR